MGNEVDKHVGQRIRHRRWLIGLTQQELAAHVGVKFQQIQKYETGANRVSASRLWMISQVQGVSVAYYFEGQNLGEDAEQASNVVDLGRLFEDRDALQLVGMFRRLSPKHRESLASLAKAISRSE